QNETYAERMISLGARPDCVVVTGNIKFDRVEVDRANPKTEELGQGFGIGPNDPVLIAGSTQDPEEAYAIDAWLAIRKEFPHLRLIVVPRHKERFDEVAKLIVDKGCTAIRRSEMVAGSDPKRDNEDRPTVGLLDTLGELASCWGLATIAFVGGSLTN